MEKPTFHRRLFRIGVWWAHQDSNLGPMDSRSNRYWTVRWFPIGADYLTTLTDREWSLRVRDALACN